MELNKEYCLIRTEHNFYVYDFVNYAFTQCNEIVYTLLNHLEYKEIKYVTLRKIRSKINELSSYPDELLLAALSQVKKLYWKIEDAKKRFTLFEYPGYTKKDVLESLAKTKQIIIEITEKCNLRCTYCCYGELYKNKDSYLHTGNNLSLEYLKVLLNLKKLYGTLAPQEELIITFYGGEPLLEIDTIKKIIEEISVFFPSGLNLQYTLTTNGLLLNKCTDFLVKNNFKVYISLDGDRNHNVYRKLRTGEESFDIIEKNILFIQENYPAFFRENVFFLSVLHNRNNCVDVCRYFEKYNKFPMFSPLSEDNINPKNKTEFSAIKEIKKYNKPEADAIRENFPEIYERYLSDKESMEHYLKISPLRDLPSIYDDENKIYPGQSCAPFQHRVFVTTKGTLYLCERSNRKFCFGKILNGKIFIYTKRINSYYQSIYSLFSKNCVQCYKHLSCDKCFFQQPHLFGCKNCRKQADEAKAELVNLIISNEEEL